MFPFRLLLYITIGASFISIINIFSETNEWERKQERRDALEKLYEPPSDVIELKLLTPNLPH